MRIREGNVKEEVRKRRMGQGVVLRERKEREKVREGQIEEKGWESERDRRPRAEIRESGKGK